MNKLSDVFKTQVFVLSIELILFCLRIDLFVSHESTTNLFSMCY